jgi:UDP-glucuronate 4-epimerase
MNKNKILITGCCGFIGFHLALKFLNNPKFEVYGIDSLNSYYSTKLKKKRLLILKKKKILFFLKKIYQIITFAIILLKNINLKLFII